MGMFDTVYIECPSCGVVAEIQSKAGRCSLDRYKATSVPLVVADDINGEKIFCGGCDTRFSLVCSAPKRVVVKAIVDDDNTWD